MTYTREEVLKHFLQSEALSQATIKSHYLKFRETSGITYRCDLSDCPHPDGYWKGEKLTLILDHINGNTGANRPEDLRLLCPNCASLLATHAGGNKGRVEEITDSLYSFLINELKNYAGISDTGTYKLS